MALAGRRALRHPPAVTTPAPPPTDPFWSRDAEAALAARLAETQPETDFARGVRAFGAMLLRVMVLFVVAVNQALGRPLPDAVLFAVALAVGMSPELLPAVVSVTLSAGARALARRGVLVRRLPAIEDLGGMQVLCTDKTGTLTEGRVEAAAVLAPDGAASEKARRLAYLNAALETGIENPLDAALVAIGGGRGPVHRGRAERWTRSLTTSSAAA